MARGGSYDGPVCYLDGWHRAVDDDGTPGERLFLQDDGSYRRAAEGDSSWHDRHHRGFALVEMEGGLKSVAVSAEEMGEIRKMLDERRGA